MCPDTNQTKFYILFLLTSVNSWYWSMCGIDKFKCIRKKRKLVSFLEDSFYRLYCGMLGEEFLCWQGNLIVFKNVSSSSTCLSSSSFSCNFSLFLLYFSSVFVFCVKNRKLLIIMIIYCCPLYNLTSPP